jgi:hypothetical protein
MMDRKVFFLEPPKHGHDVSNAAKHGEVRTVWPEGSKRPSVFRPNEYGACLLKRLQEEGFAAERDMLCMSGSIVTVSVAVGCLMSKWPAIKLLMFSSVESRYVERDMDAAQMSAASEFI